MKKGIRRRNLRQRPGEAVADLPRETILRDYRRGASLRDLALAHKISYGLAHRLCGEAGILRARGGYGRRKKAED